MKNGLEELLSNDELFKIIKFLKNHREKNPFFRLSFVIMVSWASSAVDNVTMLRQIPIRSFSQPITHESNIKKVCTELIHELINKLSDFENNGSGFVMQGKLQIIST